MQETLSQAGCTVSYELTTTLLTVVTLDNKLTCSVHVKGKVYSGMPSKTLLFPFTHKRLENYCTEQTPPLQWPTILSTSEAWPLVVTSRNSRQHKKHISWILQDLLKNQLPPLDISHNPSALLCPKLSAEIPLHSRVSS